MTSTLRSALLLSATLLLPACAGLHMPDRPARAQLTAKIEAAGADVHVKKMDDGGLLLGGTLDGRQIVIAFPVDWNGGDALVFAHGYTLPGTPVKLPENPLLNDNAGGLLKYAYLQGYAVGASAYDKAGLGVQTGAESTFRLKQFLDRIGARRVYLAGGSMGGNIVMSLVDDHPGAFAGALAMCGVDHSFAELIGQLIDTRAVYDYYTANTPYALPGSHDLKQSALSPVAPWGLGWMQGVWGIYRLKQIFEPVMALFAAARSNPSGSEAQIVRKVSAITGWDEDPASFALPLATIALGMDDILLTAGGNPYDNSARVYGARLLSADEAAALNRGVARIKADPQAAAYLARWHDATGRFDTPLVTLHNRIDSLVPYAQTTELRSTVTAAKNAAHLAQFTVPPLRLPLPFSELDGYMHCGFHTQQAGAAWDELRHWVESGKKPVSGDRP